MTELQAYIDQFFLDDIDREKVQDSICKGMVDGLGDVYAAYYNEEEYKDMVDQEIHQLLSAHQGANSQPTVQQETKDASKEGQSEHLPNTASLEASFAAEAVLLAALGGFLLAGKKKEE